MTNTLKIGIAVLVLAVIGAYFFPQFPVSNGSTPSFGAVSGMLAESYIPYVSVNQGYNSAKGMTLNGGAFTLGASGTAQTNQITTTCAMKANISIAATTTGYAFCTGVTGVTSSDNVVADFATTTGTIAYNDNWIITSAKASTTAGAIDFVLFNLTGVANVPSAVSKIGSTTAIIASH